MVLPWITVEAPITLNLSDGECLCRRNSLLALEQQGRVREFYMAFEGLLPPKHSLVRDKDIASYLAMKLDTLRDVRYELKTKGLLKY